MLPSGPTSPALALMREVALDGGEVEFVGAFEIDGSPHLRSGRVARSELRTAGEPATP